MKISHLTHLLFRLLFVPPFYFLILSFFLSFFICFIFIYFLFIFFFFFYFSTRTRLLHPLFNFIIIIIIIIIIIWIHDSYCLIRVCFFSEPIYLFSIHFILNELSSNHFPTSKIFVKISSLKSLSTLSPRNS